MMRIVIAKPTSSFFMILAIGMRIAVGSLRKRVMLIAGLCECDQVTIAVVQYLWENDLLVSW